MPSLAGTGNPGRNSSRTWWICGLLMLATMLNYMDRQTVSLSVERLYEAFGRSPQYYGNTEAVFAFAFALGSLVFGMIVDRFCVDLVYASVEARLAVAGSMAGFATN